MQHNKNELITLALEKSKIALKTAEENIEMNRFDCALNRVYYAIFYAASALAIKNDFSTSKHSQMIGWFNKKFLYENKIFESDMFKIYEDAFRYRQKSDYDFTYMSDLETAKTMLNDAKIFVKKIIHILQ